MHHCEKDKIKFKKYFDAFVLVDSYTKWFILLEEKKISIVIHNRYIIDSEYKQ